MGEESGRIGSSATARRDGLLNSLLLANAMAEGGPDSGPVGGRPASRIRRHQYGRIDLTIPSDVKEAAIAPRPAPSARRPGICRQYPFLPPGDLDGVQVLPGQPRGRHQANAAETWAPAAPPAALTRCCASIPSPAQGKPVAVLLDPPRLRARAIAAPYEPTNKSPQASL